MNKNPLRVSDYLGHILQAIAHIERYCEDMTEGAFLENSLVGEPPNGAPRALQGALSGSFASPF